MSNLSAQFLDAIRDVSAGNTKVARRDFLNNGALAVVDQGQQLVAGYTDDVTAAVKSELPLIVFGDHTRAFKFIDFPFAMGADGVKVLQVREGFDPRFVYHYLRSRRIPSAGYSRHFKFLKEILIPHPPLSEQRRIAAILDHGDAPRSKRREVLTHLDTLAQSIFSDMFGDVTSNEQGIRVATIEEVADRVTDGEHKTPRRSDGGVPLLSARNIREGWIDFENVDYVEEDVYAVLSRRLEPQPGDILISCSGTIGRVAQVRQQSRFAMVRSAALVRPSAALNSTFLERLLATPSLKAIMLLQANSSAQANLFQNQIRRLPVLVPTLSDQEMFAKRIDQVDRQANLTRSALAVDSELFASIQSRAFRGEL